MQAQALGYHELEVPELRSGTRYSFRLDGGELRPDPASRYQPEGVHGPSELIDLAFAWTDGQWNNRPLRDYVIYELHVGTFTAEGTFSAVTRELDRLRGLGVTAVEIMPVGQFPGTRNWGYDGVGLHAVQNSYGGPRELQKLVDCCHAKGLAVILDVVYNHLGPEGNYLHEFGPYFTDTYRTPWGDALNFDGAGSDEVRRFFIDNALMWLRDFHVDALRLDAVHAIFDRSSYPFLQELADNVRELSQATWSRYLIPESDANDPRLIRPSTAGGLGLDAVWADDLHHAIHTLLTGENDGYYQDYGSPSLLRDAIASGFAFSGQYSPYRGRRHGADAGDREPHQFVVCCQNHDQVGNRASGDRLATLVDLQAQKLAASLVLLAPQTPLLFMGQEYGEVRPFLYFTSHQDPGLAEAVRSGRKREFADFGGAEEPPDPQDPQTFRRSILRPEVRREGQHRQLENLHRSLIQVRKHAKFGGKARCELQDAVLIVRYGPVGAVGIIALFNLRREPISFVHRLSGGTWKRILDAEDPEFGGAATPDESEKLFAGESRIQLSPYGFAVLTRDAA